MNYTFPVWAQKLNISNRNHEAVDGAGKNSGCDRCSKYSRVCSNQAIHSKISVYCVNVYICTVTVCTIASNNTTSIHPWKGISSRKNTKCRYSNTFMIPTGYVYLLQRTHNMLCHFPRNQLTIPVWNWEIFTSICSSFKMLLSFTI